MPYQALVTFGVAFCMGLFSHAAPAWCSDVNVAQQGEPSKTTISKRVIHADTQPAVTLEEAIQRTLTQNLELSASAREVEARRYEARQAGYYPNPELSVEVENFSGSGEFSGTDSAETTVTVSQKLELGDKRKQRQAVSQLEMELAARELDAVRAALVATTSDRYYSLLAAQERLALAEEQTDLADKVLAAVSERIDAGKTARMEKIRFQALVAEANLRREVAHQDMVVGRYALAALWDQVDWADGLIALGRLEDLHVVPEWAELLAKIPESPTNSLLQTAVRKAEHRLALEQSNRIPDLTVSLGAKNIEETDDSALVAGMAIDLPLFNRNQGAVSAAQLRQIQARETARTEQLRLQTRLNQLWQKLQASRREAVLLRDELIPAIQQSFDAITYGYQAGKFGFLEVLEAEQALFETRNRYIDSLEEYHHTYTELERMLGQKIDPESDRPVASVSTLRGQL